MAVLSSHYSMTSQSPPNVRPVSVRNYGIDALRIVAMLMVCVIHMNLFTKAHFEVVPKKEYFYYFGIWTEAVGMIGVNLYAMITGYVCVMSSWRYSRYVRLWVLVAFYTVLLFAIGYALSLAGVLPYSIGVGKMAKLILCLGFGSSYWYFAAYTGLFFIIPFLNQGLQRLSREKFTLLGLVLVVLLPIINLRGGDVIYSGGYNMIWLTALYVVGAYIKLYPPRVLRSWWLLLVAGVCTLQPLLFALIGLPPINGYTWPVAVAYSIALFIVFTRLEFKSGVLKRVIAWAAPASFSVYLLHVHPWSWSMLVKYVPWVNTAWDYPWWFPLAGGLVMYLVCTIIDMLRIGVFRVCKVDAVADYFASVIENAVRRALNVLSRQ